MTDFSAHIFYLAQLHLYMYMLQNDASFKTMLRSMLALNSYICWQRAKKINKKKTGWVSCKKMNHGLSL